VASQLCYWLDLWSGRSVLGLQLALLQTGDLGQKLVELKVKLPAESAAPRAYPRQTFLVDVAREGMILQDMARCNA